MDEEYCLVLSELEKLKSTKEDLRSKMKTGIDEVTKQSLTDKDREDAMK
jgi:hypothetical protein